MAHRSTAVFVTAAVVGGGLFCTLLARAAREDSPVGDGAATQRRAGGTAKNATALFNHAYFLYSHHKYHQALREVNKSLKMDPKFQNAQLLKSLIQKRLGHGKKRGHTATATHHRHKKKAGSLLSMKDIYKIRIAEFDLRHLRGPLSGKIVGGQKTLSKFWRRVVLRDPRFQNPAPTRRDRREFLNPGHFKQQVHLILQIGPAKYRDKIHLTTDPRDIDTFRQFVQPFVLQSCATVGCHRGQDSHGFRLRGARSGSPNVRQTYTNFYTMSKLTYKGEPMVNRARPDLSLFIQYVMAPHSARYRHPGKKGPGNRVINKTKILNWVRSLRYPMRSYGIGGQSASKSAGTKPAAHPRGRRRRR